MKESNLFSEVIIVDDDPVSSYLTTEILSDYYPDIKIRCFNRASECLDFLVKKEGKRLILLDINMPEMNGWEFIDRYSQHDFKDRIVILTSSINSDDQERAASHDLGFLSKPMRPEELETIIQTN